MHVSEKTLRPRGTFTVEAIDRRTGRLRWKRAGLNALEDEGEEFIANALASGGRLQPTNSNLQCRIRRSSSDSTGGFTSSGGPMTAQVRVDENGSTVNTGGSPIYHSPPSVAVPVRLKWYDASLNTYALYGADIRNGNTRLARAAFSGSPANKAADDVITVTYILNLSQGAGDLAPSAAAALLARIGGRANTGWTANLKTADGTNAAPTSLTQSVSGSVLTTEFRDNNPGLELRNKRVTGFTLQIGNTLVMDYDWAPPDTVIPARGAGGVGWDIDIDIGGTAIAGLSAYTIPTVVRITALTGNTISVFVHASGGSGAWSITRTSGIWGTTIRGSNGTWEIQVTGPRGRSMETLDITVTHGSESVDLQVALETEGV